MKKINLLYLHSKDPFFVDGLARNDRYYLFINGVEVKGRNLCVDTAEAVLKHLGYEVDVEFDEE